MKRHPNMGKLRNHVVGHVPRCLAAVCTTLASLIEDRGAEAVAFRLSHAADNDVGQIHGYDLRDYNPDFHGPCEFISPLSIRWPGASPVVIFDSDIHGYHGEMQSSAKLRGDGPLHVFSCPKCGRQQFGVSVQFDYWDACYDLWEDEPESPVQDYFCNIMVSGACVDCQHVSRVLDMDL